MGRGTVFVVGYSVVLLLLFVIFIYLMSTVNPDPLVSGNSSDVPEPDDGPVIMTFPEGILEEDEYFIRGRNGERLGHGLQRSYDDGQKEIELREHAVLLPLYHHLLRTGGFVNSSNVRYVEPPKIPSLERMKATATTTTTTLSPILLRKGINNINNTSVINSIKAPAKGFRRSVNEIDTYSVIEEQNSGVILKIMDDIGRPRIEIKLGPNDLFERNKMRHYRSSGNKLDTVNSSHVDEGVSGDKNNISTKFTIIKILPNNTMVFEETDYSLVSLNTVKDKPLDFNEDHNAKGVNFSTNGNRGISGNESEAIFKEITLLVKPLVSKNDSFDVRPIQNNTEMFSLKMLIDNETRSINKFVDNPKNDSEEVLVDKTRLNIDVTENITEFNITNGSSQNEISWRNRNDSQTDKSVSFFKNNFLKDLQVS